MDSWSKWVRSCLGKKRYHAHFFAEKVAKKIKTERGTTLNVYPCRTCAGYHLTKGALTDTLRTG